MIVLSSPNLGFVGGIERHVFDLAGGLAARGHRVGLVYGAASGPEATRFAGRFDAVEPIASASSLLRRARAAYFHKLAPAQFFDALPAGAPRAVAIHDHDATCVRRHRYVPVTNAPCERAGGLECLTHGCVVVRTRGQLVPLGVRDPFALARSTRELAGRAELVTCSEFLRRSLLAIGVAPHRVRVIHPVPPASAVEPTPPPVEHRLLFVGQVIRGKGLDLLLDALALLPSASLTVAGGGSSLEAEIRHADDLGLTPRVRFLGPLAPEQVDAEYARARVVVVPSRWPEPFGMVGIEAMRLGRVVVGARHGGIPEWLAEGQVGLAFRPGDVADLASALHTALAHPRYDAMAAAGRDRARSAFDFGSMVGRVEQLLGLDRQTVTPCA
jgi:glycosyltransferase involved in cell wall biosynthesis